VIQLMVARMAARTPNLLGVRMPRVTSVIAMHGKFRRNEVAVRFPDPKGSSAPVEVTYGQFVQEMDTIASNVQQGYRRARIATLLTNDSPRTLTTMLGCVRGGACLVPLNATLKANQIEGMLKDCDAKVVIASERYSSLIADSVPGIRRVGFDFSNGKWESFGSMLSGSSRPVDQDDGPLGMEDEFNVIYSSGTTGLPKGIVQTHANRLHWAWSNAITMRFQHDSRALTTTALYSNGTFLITLPTLFVGATLNVMKQFDPVQALEIIQREKITHVFMVPTQLKMCVDAGASRYDLSSLRMVLSAGSTLSSELKKRVLREITPNLFELYGNSEGFASMLFPEEHATKFNTVGRPLLGNDLKIVETEGNQELPRPGEVGEICVRGPGMMLSYNDRPEETMKDIWEDPTTGLKYFRSGDVGKVDKDGYLSLMERKKDMIISGGFNVFPKDIEEIMLEHPDIHDVAVVAASHEKWGETPVAIVIPRADSRLVAEDVQKWTNERVSKVQRLSYVKVLRHDEGFPRNVLGKVMKKELRERLKEWGMPRM